MPQVYINGKRVRVNANASIGKGGEAEIFELPGNQALKLFKQPGHADFLTPDESAAAEARIREHQKKLPAFPKGLPSRVVTPLALARSGKTNSSAIVGYTMPFLKGANLLYDYSRKKFRVGISNQVVVDIFRDLHQTVAGIHRAGVVIGDFNDLNVLVTTKKQPEAYIIDADSFQFGAFQARMFTMRFVDPLLCSPNELQLYQSHNENSDWYAYCIMLMQSLLFVGPYGGIHRPADKTKKIPHDARPLHRKTVFDSDVKYPKPAIPYKVLSDDVLHYFHQVFQKDVRGIFPLRLLEEMHWTTCKKCNLDHARSACPDCATMVTGIVKQVVVIRGKVKATRIFETKGSILHATTQKGKLTWIYHQDDKYVRHYSGQTHNLLNGKLDPKIRYRVSGDRSFIAKTGVVIEMPSGNRTGVDNFRYLPIFDTNSEKLFYLHGSQLLREDQTGPTYIGDVLNGQTLLWTGEKFGFGYYALGAVYNGFIFDTTKKGLVDVKLPKIPGQLIDSTCVFAKDLVWVFFANQDRGKTYNHCVVFDHSGQTVGMTKVNTDDPGQQGWLQQIRGKFAVGNQLYSPTDDGIVRVELNNSAFTIKEFPDTEPFVDSSCQLFPDSDGIYVVSNREILKLQIG